MPAALQVPAAARLLDTWEAGLDADPPSRAVLLLCALCDDTPAEQLGALPVGHRNRLLLRARLLLFGTICDTVADCPDCGAELEAALPVPALLSASEPANAGTIEQLVTDGFQVRYRLPTAADLTAVADVPVDAAARQLLDRCVVSVHRGDGALSCTDLPDDVREAVECEMARADPDAVVKVALTCPCCTRPVSLPLDPASLLWSEIEEWAVRTLHEVHDLATAYGWDEDHILAMTPRRRRTYRALSSGAGSTA